MLPDEVARWRNLAEIESNANVDLEVMLAVIWQESHGNAWAYRYEEGWQYFVAGGLPLYKKGFGVSVNRASAYNKLGSTEFHAQSASYGLMQVMGSVAREYSFEGPLTRLCDPAVSIRIGSQHLWEYGFRRGQHDLETALRRYNGSSAYAVEVLAKIDSVRSVA